MSVLIFVTPKADENFSLAFLTTFMPKKICINVYINAYVILSLAFGVTKIKTDIARVTGDSG